MAGRVAVGHAATGPRMAREARTIPSAHVQVTLALLLGAVVAVPVAVVSRLPTALLCGWDAATIAYMGFVWLTIWPRDAAATARLAEREDPTRAAADLLQLSAALASLVAVGFELVNAAHSSGVTQTAHLLLGLGSVGLSWALVHTVFTLRYARMYYADEDGGITFNQQEPPTYADFAYVAFTIGMTFQVSDTPLQTGSMRVAALRHALLSFVFVTGILAATVNLVATLTSQ
jgi:uncharacterized membrane protein